MRPPVAVIIPNYNYAKLVPLAIEAVICQMQPHDELIVIDDCSQDDSISTIQEALNATPGATLIRHSQNEGVIVTLNEGLAMAKAEYICFPGADDFVAAGAFDQALDLLARYPEAAFCSGLTAIVDETGKDLGRFPNRIVRRQPAWLSPELVRRELMVDDSWLTGLVIYRKRRLQEAGGFRTDLGSFCDGFACRLLAARWGCCFIPMVFYYWRRTLTSLSSRETLDLYHNDILGRHATQLMLTIGAADFPPAYPRRWLGRWRFGTRHFRIKQKQTILGDALLGRCSSNALRKLICLGLVTVRLPILVVFFLRYRPYDVISVLRRRVQNVLYRKLMLFRTSSI